MSRYTGPKCRLCRREGAKLFLKADKCLSAKCPFEKRPTVPGVRTFRRGKPTGYQLRLREKQKVKRFYGLSDKTFYLYYKEAVSIKGNTGEQLLSLFERRLDNVVYHLGFAQSRTEARQVIGHGHVTVDGRKVNIPSFIVKEGMVISHGTRDSSKKLIKENIDFTKMREKPTWVNVDQEAITGKVLSLPTRDDVSVEIDEQLIIEFCSR
ncbi:MAG: 30S ribosomal protein S4 [Planctomycetes bacterium]|nr:30S ribosomal protein S4 [Planctomycetota bacterium]